MTVTPITPAAAALRVAIVGAAEAELIAAVAAAPDAKAASPQAADAAGPSAGRSFPPLFAELSQAALLTLQQALLAGPPPAPPMRRAALTGQTPAPTALPADADAAAIVQHLRPRAEQAEARQTLQQPAALPDGTTTWMFELPVATPQGTAIAQFEVERDAPEAGLAEAAESWRVRFSVDIEPLGPAHVHLGMKGGRAAVTVWAEREGGLDLLRSQGAELARALPGDVVFRVGAPRQSVPARGRFVDQAS
ncbi:MAG: flagellar hook-length control protein FliK [Phenylobacterium sp.]|nr:flagellar hook-length control protein FliK [Phenylobacterium sp.]